MVELGADPRRGLDALLSWWPTGAQVTDRHRELAVRAGASQVEAALRR
jgi:ribosomal protein S16